MYSTKRSKLRPIIHGDFYRILSILLPSNHKENGKTTGIFTIEPFTN